MSIGHQAISVAVYYGSSDYRWYWLNTGRMVELVLSGSG
jgi:hypothetical protein